MHTTNGFLIGISVKLNINFMNSFPKNVLDDKVCKCRFV